MQKQKQDQSAYTKYSTKLLFLAARWQRSKTHPLQTIFPIWSLPWFPSEEWCTVILVPHSSRFQHPENNPGYFPKERMCCSDTSFNVTCFTYLIMTQDLNMQAGLSTMPSQISVPHSCRAPLQQGMTRFSHAEAMPCWSHAPSSSSSSLKKEKSIYSNTKHHDCIISKG